MKKGWLSRTDFDKLDELLGKLGYGGYYDFLQCLKQIASRSGAIYLKKGDDILAWDVDDIKTIPEMMAMITVWSGLLSDFFEKNPELIEQILDVKTQ